jgi:hypothetical protein
MVQVCPLPIQSAYYCENSMGIIASRVQTGTLVAEQVMKKMSTQQSVVSYCASKLDTCSQPFLRSLYRYMPKLCANASVKCKSFAASFVPTDEMLSLIRPNSDETFRSLQRLRVNNELICTRSYNCNKATTTNNHCIKTVKNKYFIIINIVELIDNSTFSTRICLLCHELQFCQKVSLISEDSKSPKFSYVSTYRCESTKLSLVELSQFANLATYCVVGDMNYVFDIFNRHL